MSLSIMETLTPLKSKRARSTMRAVVLNSYGSPDNLQVDDVPRPRLLPHQVLIQVHAAGVNPIDWRIRRGSLRFIIPGSFPLVLGYDVSGTVLDVGRNITAFQANEEVFCFLDGRHGGGYAEYAVASAGVVVPKPKTLSHEEAAAVPLAAMTALQALRDHGKITAGSKVLINGAAGGVGTFAVQLAKAFESDVTAVCSATNVEFVRELGANHVIDYQRDDFTQSDSQYDIVFDAVAKSTYLKCRSILKPTGIYITTVPSLQSSLFQSLPRLCLPKRCRIILVRRSGSDLRTLQELIDQHKVRPVVQQTFPLVNAAEAHRQSEAGHVRGKLVLKVR